MIHGIGVRGESSYTSSFTREHNGIYVVFITNRDEVHILLSYYLRPESIL